MTIETPEPPAEVAEGIAVMDDEATVDEEGDKVMTLDEEVAAVGEGKKPKYEEEVADDVTTVAVLSAPEGAVALAATVESVDTLT